jgi:hypothetical protein
MLSTHIPIAFAVVEYVLLGGVVAVVIWLIQTLR